MRRRILLALLAAALAPGGARAWTWPVEGPVLRPFVFGDDPYLGGQHRGIDIGVGSGTTVVAPAAGTVTFAGTVPSGGETIAIHTDEGYSATLLHLGSIVVSRGDVVAEGEPVGTVGPSGAAVPGPPYVYFGIRVLADPQGYVDPLGFLPHRDAEPPAPPPAPASDPAPPPPAAAVTPPAPEAVPAPAPPPAVEPAPATTPGANAALPAQPARPPTPAGQPATEPAATPVATTEPQAQPAPVAVPAAAAREESAPIEVPVPAAAEAHGQAKPDPTAGGEEGSVSGAEQATPAPRSDESRPRPRTVAPAPRPARIEAFAPAPRSSFRPRIRAAAAHPPAARPRARPDVEVEGEIPARATPSQPSAATAGSKVPASAEKAVVVDPAPVRRAPARAVSPRPAAVATGADARGRDRPSGVVGLTRPPRHHRDLPPLGFIAPALALVAALAVGALAHRRRGAEVAPEAARIIPPDVDRAPAETDSRRSGVAVCSGPEAYRTRGWIRRASGHPRPLLPAQGPPRAARQRHRRARYAGHGRGRRRGGFAA